MKSQPPDCSITSAWLREHVCWLFQHTSPLAFTHVSPNKVRSSHFSEDHNDNQKNEHNKIDDEIKAIGNDKIHDNNTNNTPTIQKKSTRVIKRNSKKQNNNKGNEFKKIEEETKGTDASHCAEDQNNDKKTNTTKTMTRQKLMK